MFRYRTWTKATESGAAADDVPDVAPIVKALSRSLACTMGAVSAMAGLVPS